ncbi:hypothetical protein GIB53_27015, partial [Escherichia coli]|nr:hypothetical protein [Escherichia coli]
ADRNQDPFIWGAILGEEVGEFHQAVLHDRFGVAGNPVCVPEMDSAIEGLAYGNESLYYRVR